MRGKLIRKKIGDFTFAVGYACPLKFIIILIQPGIEVPVSQLGRILSQPGNQVADADTCNIS